jgi:Conjugative transposon, TraM/Domain of unknown function (DUF4138)
VGGPEPKRVGAMTGNKTVQEESAQASLPPVANIVRPAAVPPADPQLDRLNNLLDKAMRLQQGKSAMEEMPAVKEPVLTETEVETIPAVVEEDQTLVSGATMVLRIAEEITISGVRIPRNQLVYGLVSISNDRMLVDIHSIRQGRNIYTTALQVYDLDGLPGIHIPGMLSREVAKQSADQGIGSFNLTPIEPGIGAQAASAGIQTVKSLFSRKIRLVRASVPAGYRVLLRNSRGAGRNAVRVWVDSAVAGRPDSAWGRGPVLKRTPVKDSSVGVAKDTADLIRATMREEDRGVAGDTIREVGEKPVRGMIHDTIIHALREDFVPFLHRSVREGEVSLTLRGIYLREGLLWCQFLVQNDSRIDYSPDYIRPFIRDRRKMKRMAVQEIPLPVVCEQLPTRVAAGSGQVINLAFAPFALGKDKLLVLQLAEKDGGRELNLEIKSKTLLNIQ